MNSTLRIQLGFAYATDATVQETASAVLNNLWGNAAFPAVPVPSATLQTALDAYMTALAATTQGGTAATAAKNNARAAVVALLRQLAAYVQVNCGGDRAAAFSSGFKVVSTNRARTELSTPAIIALVNGGSGCLILRVKAVKHAKTYEVRIAAVAADGTPAPWQRAGFFSNSRAIPLTSLTPGVLYTVQVRATGGSTGYSGWSDPSSHMSL